MKLEPNSPVFRLSSFGKRSSNSVDHQKNGLPSQVCEVCVVTKKTEEPKSATANFSAPIAIRSERCNSKKVVFERETKIKRFFVLPTVYGKSFCFQCLRLET